MNLPNISSDYPVPCSVCDTHIFPHHQHVMEKAWKKYGEFGWNLLFEMVLCADCMSSKQNEISEESRNNIKAFMTRQNLENEAGMCAINGKDLASCEFIQGAFISDGFHTNELYISDEALEELQSILSKETKDNLDRFTEEQLGPPGAWKDLFSPTRPILF